MVISAEGKIGIGIALLLGAGAGAIMIWPAQAWIGWVTLVSCSLGLIWLVHHHFYGAGNGPALTKKQLIWFGVLTVCVLTFTAWRVSPWIYNFRYGAKSEAHGKITQTETGSQFDNEISVSCEWSPPPSQYRPDKNIYVYEMAFEAVPPPFAGAITYWGPGAGTLPPLKTQSTPNYAKCIIINYSDSALINVQLTMSVVFQEKKMTGKSNFTSGAIVAQRTLVSPSFDLGPSSAPNASDYFYIWNTTPFFVSAAIPQNVSFELPVTLVKTTAKILPSNSTSIPYIGLFPIQKP
jgi:hypothetical protein